MTIIFSTGEFWIETITLEITLGTAAGFYSSLNIPFEKPGRIVGFAMGTSQADNDTSSEEMGIVRTVFNDGVVFYSYGMFAYNARTRAYKNASVDTGTLETVLTVYMRK